MTDIEALLQPIAPGSPCGEDLSFSAEFDAIQESRRSDDATLDQGEWVTAIKAADWPDVATQCADLLRNRSKDLRLAVWAAEAWTHAHGLSGFADGCVLVAELCARYWDDVHPTIDAEDRSARVGNLGWMLKQSAGWLRAVPLTDAPDGHFTAVDLDMATRGHSGGGESPYPDQARVESARMATPFDFYRQMMEAVPRAREGFALLERVVDEKLGADGPSFSAARDALDDVLGRAVHAAVLSGVSAPDGQSRSAPDDSPSAPQADRLDGEIRNRRDALRQLQLVADYFRRTEPHSPVAYLAERAARWGSMPLHVWLRTVLKDNPALGQLQELLDVDVTAGHEDSSDITT